MKASIQDKKIELIQWLSTLDDESIIENLIRFRESDKKDWWNNTSDEEKQSIEKGIKDADAGKFKSQQKVKKLFEKWQ
jgi:predicted transcriptional regulator